jgi:Undecaprenyl-phosphate galactose phosphotransferase WbaP
MATAILDNQCFTIPQPTARPGLSTAALIIFDLAILAFAWVIAVLGRQAFGADYPVTLYFRLWPALFLFTAVFALRRLYPADAMSPVEEFRRITTSTAIVFANLIVSSFTAKHADSYSRIVVAGAWILSTVLLLVGRTMWRATIRRKPWWGTSTVLIGSGPMAAAVLRSLHEDQSLGIHVVGILADGPLASQIEGVPVLGGFQMAPAIAREYRIRNAIVVASGNGAMEMGEMIRQYGRYFPHLLVVPPSLGPANVSVETKALGALLALEVKQNLLLPWPCICKRILDLALAATLAFCLLPLIVLISLLVKLTSRGPVFYGQGRIGRDQHRFKAWKFRTMLADADQVLEYYLTSNPALEAEWARGHKLKNDPRVTPLGRFLRQWSLDELPQLWNVLRGDMSLVGPRPIVDAEIPQYASRFAEYSSVLPGLTGLWQVSGRSDTTYQQRVDLDSYYANNWSPWFDIYLLAKTFGAVWNRRGAY